MNMVKTSPEKVNKINVEGAIAPQNQEHFTSHSSIQRKAYVTGYPSMWWAVQKIADRVKFEDLKSFYGLGRQEP